MSRRLLRSVDRIQDVYCRWVKGAQRIPVEAAGVHEDPPVAGGVGCFFSGGVDSFYTYLKNRGEITDLVLVRGFDRILNLDAVYRQARERNAEVARAGGKRLREVVTNVRRLSDPMVDIGLYHGALLAAVGHVLGASLAKVLVPASYAYEQLYPWGSHPLLDPLWSSERLALVHDGCEADRYEKIARQIAGSDLALRTLRVCWELNGDYNCGACEKCLRTMVGLLLAGALDRCTTFARPLTGDAVARLRLRSHSQLLFNQENLRYLAAKADPSPREREVHRALRRVVRRGERRVAFRLWRGRDQR